MDTVKKATVHWSTHSEFSSFVWCAEKNLVLFYSLQYDYKF